MKQTRPAVKSVQAVAVPPVTTGTPKVTKKTDTDGGGSITRVPLNAPQPQPPKVTPSSAPARSLTALSGPPHPAVTLRRQKYGK